MLRFPSSSSRHLLREAPARAFTLVELLVVVAIAAVLLTLASPAVFRTLQGNLLSTTGEQLLNQLAVAQLQAAAGNSPVEVRFYVYEENEELSQLTACHAYQLFRLYDQPQPNPADVTGAEITEQALGSPMKLGKGIIISSLPALTPLASGTLVEDGGKNFTTHNARYFACRFYPNGSTNLAKNITSSHLTLVADADATNTGPANFYTIQIDPYNGKLRAYRP